MGAAIMAAVLMVITVLGGCAPAAQQPAPGCAGLLQSSGASADAGGITREAASQIPPLAPAQSREYRGVCAD